MRSSDIEELYRMASNYNMWSLESMRYTLYEIKNKLSDMKRDERDISNE
tara:strand:+ start:1153 stop:1299 length:147 start_codon:yes stop_codon:yes gene_type:complete